MNRQIIYIINPIAGTRKKYGLQKIIERETNRRKIPFKIFYSEVSNDFSFLKPIIKEEKITDVIIAGGDGSINKVVGSLLNEDVNFGIIPCGSGNGLALGAGIPRKSEKSLQIIFNGKAKLIDGFMINNQFACMLCGLGFDAKVAHDFAKENRRGLNTYVRKVLKNLITAKTYHFSLQLADNNFESEAYFICVANSNQFGNNFTIAPKASLTDGLLDVVIAASVSKTNMIFQTIKQLAGWNKLVSDTFLEKKGMVYFQTDKLSLINHNEAPLHIDGDPAETAKIVNVQILKKCFRLIQP
jgi:YegS/Rv2252/BmrU family lipid kinase